MDAPPAAATPARLAALQASQGAMVADLLALVACESPSADLAATARCADLLVALARPHLGAEPERLVVDGRVALRWRLGSGAEGPGGRRVLVLGHLDTVWPVGALATHPAEVRDGRLTGPGCFDMKAGLVQAVHGLATLPDPTGVTLLVTSDEEIGSPTSRALIEEEAAGAVAALVCEPSSGGAVKHERKGVSLYSLEVTGRAAHAGLEPHRGANATVEVAHQVIAVAGLGDPDAGTTVTPTVVAAGTVTNTVPARATLAIDARATTVAEQARVDGALRALVPVVAGTSLTLHGGPNRPPLDRSAAAALVDVAHAEAVRLGLEPLPAVAVGGASDGNFTAGIGTPTLDGLGAVGDGAHADGEHVLVDAMPAQAALLAGIVEALLGGRMSGA